MIKDLLTLFRGLRRITLIVAIPYLVGKVMFASGLETQASFLGGPWLLGLFTLAVLACIVVIIFAIGNL